MPKPRVYVETTIPNVYYEARTSPEMIERRRWTRAWWADASKRYELFTSVVVLNELGDGTSSRVRMRMSLLAGIPDDAIEEVRSVRRRLSARFDDDPHKITAYYMEDQKQFGDRLLSSRSPDAAQRPDDSGSFAA